MSANCCDFLVHEVAFYKDSIRPCCSFSIEGDVTPFVNNFDGDINEFKKYLQKRDQFIEIFNSGNKPVCLEKCTTYIPNQTRDTCFKLTNLIISNYTKCSCNCMYCEQASYGQDKEYKNWLNTRTCYDIKPLLEYLRNNNYIEKNCRILICGGEPSEYPKGELEWLIYFAKSCVSYLLILSSGIYYSKAIESALKSSNTILKISVDSGTKKTFEKIKRVKAYNQVWCNIQNYIKSIPAETNSKVELKYIIIPEYNDNKKEINIFLRKARQVNCEYVVLDVEHLWISKNIHNKKSEKHISNLLNYFFKKKPQDIHISIEGVYEEWLWSLVNDKYNYKKE